MSVLIKVENLSKQYRLGSVSTGSLSHDINRSWHRLIGKEDPYLKLSELNDRTSVGSSDYVWALRDINFEVKQGEVLGVIGRNGAGKSTLLKILSRTTAPTIGSVKIKGRVASLLEVGTGFHPELSGRENVFLNGAILGMTKKEIQKKFDEIVDFAGVERYIDTPVKRYSSGMYVRLAFGVAAHLESEILIVDEVLAVGDAEFQKKCIGKMSDMSKGEGRTVLFVSHNLPAIKRLCTSALYLSNGGLQYDGGVNEAASYYFNEIKNNSTVLSDYKKREGNGKVRLINMELLSPQPIEVNQPLHFRLTLNQPIEKSRLILSLTVRDFDHQMLSYFVSDETQVLFEDNKNSMTSVIDIYIGHFTFRAGKYNIRIMIHDNDTSYENTCDIVESAFELEVIGSDFFQSGKPMRAHDPTALLDAKFEFK